MTTSAQSINCLLPQTQCRACGYDGCLPYAQALSEGKAAVNLCAPGGETVMLDIANLLGRTPEKPAKIQTPALAWIDENVCIGCTACIRACPVDAIMGAHKLMHTVIADECTGCGLCVAPCPVDCIYMQPIETDFLPQARSLSEEKNARFAAAEHARTRYERRQTRLERDSAERKAKLAERKAATKAKLQTAAFNPMDLIAKAMAKAQSQQDQLVTAANRDEFKNKQIETAKQRAVLRRAQRDMKYGSDEEKAAALIYLRQYKAEQEAAKAERKSKKNKAKREL